MIVGSTVFGRQGPEVRILSLRPMKQGALGRLCCFRSPGFRIRYAAAVMRRPRGRLRKASCQAGRDGKNRSLSLQMKFQTDPMAGDSVRSAR